MNYSINQTIGKEIGMSFIELLATVAIIAIVTGISAPNFYALLAKNRVITQTNAIFESLYIARSTAITQQKNVHICHISNSSATRCDTYSGYNTAWTNGWLIFVDLNANNEYDEKDRIVKIFQPTNHVNIVFNQKGRLRFFPDGTARSAGFYICDKNQLGYRHIYLLYSGRARVNQNLSTQQKEVCGSAT